MIKRNLIINLCLGEDYIKKVRNPRVTPDSLIPPKEITILSSLIKGKVTYIKTFPKQLMRKSSVIKLPLIIGRLGRLTSPIKGWEVQSPPWDPNLERWIALGICMCIFNLIQ